MEPLQIALVTSGKGTMLRYVLDACARELVPGRVVAVASNIECAALAVAKSANIPSIGCFHARDFESKAQRDEAMGNALVGAGANFVLIAGYTETLSKTLLDRFPDRAISPYPSTLPAFGELDESIGPALEYGVKMLGMTLHFHAPDSLSDGAIIAQDVIPISPDDTIESVMPRLIELEMRMMWHVLRAFARGGIERRGRKVHIHP